MVLVKIVLNDIEHNSPKNSILLQARVAALMPHQIIKSSFIMVNRPQLVTLKNRYYSAFFQRPLVLLGEMRWLLPICYQLVSSHCC